MIYLLQTRAGGRITSSPYATQNPSDRVQPTSWTTNWHHPTPNMSTSANKKNYASASRAKALATFYTHVAAKRADRGGQGN